MTAFNLTDSICSIHHRLVAQLQERRKIPHSTTKGDEGELLWLNVLSAHLPRRYAIRRGIVIDSRGQRSDAIDLIIYDPQYTPVFLAQDEHAYVFAEAVYAVFEVKYQLTSKTVKYAGDKAASVRNLHRTNAIIHHAGGEIREPRPPLPQIAGLLALDAPWPRESMQSKLSEHVGKCTAHRALDLVLCLNQGLYESEESANPEGSGSFESGTMAFVSFLYSLLHRLQRLATVPAISWPEYISQLRRAANEN